MIKCDFCQNDSSCSVDQRRECIIRDHYRFKPERNPTDDVMAITRLVIELRGESDPEMIAKHLVQNGIGIKD